jgi:predicted anti-sigma-YlaC factor YlaD
MNIKLLNLNCRAATRLLSESLDRDLTRIERIGLRLHLIVCGACRAYRRQLAAMRRMIRRHLATGGDADSEARLSAEARERILKTIEGRA